MTQQNTATLDHIQSSSTPNVGYRQLPPFSFTGHDGKITGYTIAVCNVIVDRSRQCLKLNNLTAHYTPVSFAERSPALNLRKIDMDYDMNTNTPKRTASVSFSENYYTAKMRIISLCKNNIRSISDLKGYMASLTGSSEDLLELNRVNREQYLNVSAVISTIVKGVSEKMAHNGSAIFLINDILAWPLVNHSE